jgi:hypothetical protein
MIIMNALPQLDNLQSNILTAQRAVDSRPMATLFG